MEQTSEHSMNGCRRRRCPTPARKPQKPLQRIAEVMQQEGVTPRGLARRLRTTRSKVVDAMDPSYDMRLSDLYRWRKALHVPASELLSESSESFASPIAQRARLVRIMRTVRSIQETSAEDPVQRLASHLAEKLTEIMPELKYVGAWPIKGKQRKAHELGEIAYKVVPSQLIQGIADEPA